MHPLRVDAAALPFWLRFLEADAASTGRGALEDQPDGEPLFSEHGEALGFTRLIARRR